MCDFASILSIVLKEHTNLSTKGLLKFIVLTKRKYITYECVATSSSNK